MDYYARMLKLGCFSREDVARMTGNVRTADTLIYNYKKRGLVQAVRRDLYAAISLETDSPVSHGFEVASHLFSDSYISHHTAFEFYGMANQVFNYVYVSSESRFEDFVFDGKLFKRTPSKFSEGVVQRGSVRVTDLERTIVDNIKDFTRNGGLEELLQCLSMVVFVSEEKIIKYLQLYDNQFLWQKAGFLLSRIQDIGLSSNFYDTCKNNIKKSVRYLYQDLKNENPVFSKEWSIYVPKDMLRILGQGGAFDYME